MAYMYTWSYVFWATVCFSVFLTSLYLCTRAVWQSMLYLSWRVYFLSIYRFCRTETSHMILKSMLEASQMAAKSIPTPPPPAPAPPPPPRSPLSLLHHHLLHPLPCVHFTQGVHYYQAAEARQRQRVRWYVHMLRTCAVYVHFVYTSAVVSVVSCD